MQRSTCLKLQINDQPPAIELFTDWDFAAQDDSITPIMSDKLTALALLQSQCINLPSWLTVMPLLGALLRGQQVAFIGQILELDSGVTIAAFNESGVKTAITNWTADLLPNVVNSTQINDLQTLLDTNNVPIRIVTGRTTLKVLRCTPNDLASLPTGDVVNPYVDAFDIVREMLTNTVSSLDGSGFAPAKYIAAGDYIEFASDYTLLLTLQDPEIGV